MAGLGGRQRGAHGLLVAHLADQDHVGVLAQHAAHARPNDAVSIPTSRWLMIDGRSRCRYSIGSSIVTMCRDLVSLMWLMIAASVVDLPEPVVPGEQDQPALLVGDSLDHRGQPEFVDVRTVNGITRATIDTDPRWRNALTRKRASPSTA